MTSSDPKEEIANRQSLQADIVCVGFGPAMGGFLTTLSRAVSAEDGSFIESPSTPGVPLQVLCYERSDDVGYAVSGAVTRARSIYSSFPNLDISQIPMTASVAEERVVYLLDPIGASGRSVMHRALDRVIRLLRKILPFQDDAVKLPYIPSFLHKKGGLVLSLGQFNQWVSSLVMSTGNVQIWPGMPVEKPLFNGNAVTGVRLADQGVDKKGAPAAGFMPGMDILAALTVVGDGPVGPVGRQIEEHVGMPEGHHKREWAAGMKVVVSMADDVDLKPGTVIHTMGFPEPEIFGFLYVHPERTISAGIFIPSWLRNPIRSSYRYLQHWMMHPYLWRYFKGGILKSWAAKSLMESGLRGEPKLAGDGYAVIGEASGSTNVLTGSGVDEAWATGTMLAEGVLELLKEKKPFTGENLNKTYVQRRRKSWVQKELQYATHARDGFHYGFFPGVIGMGLAGLTRGLISIPAKASRPRELLMDLEDYYRGRITESEINKIRKECLEKSVSLHDAIMDRAGWPAIPYDGKLLVSHQDVLLMGGKVQAPAGYRDNVVFLQPELCRDCLKRVCIEMCSSQAIMPNDVGAPVFDREKCIYCGCCYWNCSKSLPGNPEKMNVGFFTGAGGLHSAEN